MHKTGDLQNQNGSVSVFPNPVTENSSVILNNMNHSEVVVEIHDVKGQLVFSDEFSVNSDAFNYKLPVSNLVQGVYMLSVRNEYSAVNQKIIIK